VRSFSLIWPYGRYPRLIVALTLTRYCLQCFLCLTQAERFFFFVAAAAVGLETATESPLPDFSLRGVDRFDLFAGIVRRRPRQFLCPLARRPSPPNRPRSSTRFSTEDFTFQRPESQRDRETERQRDRETERQRERERERERESQTDRQKEGVINNDHR